MVVWVDDDAYLSAGEACDALGIKPQTLYAYVSRGLLRSYRQGVRRQRLYRRRDIEGLIQLAPGHRRRRRRTFLPRAEDWIGQV
jgi:excisionase family DNA binding protein